MKPCSECEPMSAHAHPASPMRSNQAVHDGTLLSNHAGPSTGIPGGSGPFPQNRGGVVDKQHEYGTVLGAYPGRNDDPSQGKKQKASGHMKPRALRKGSAFTKKPTSAVNPTKRPWPE